MRTCTQCGAEYEGDFCPTGCNSPAFQQILEDQRLAAKRSKEHGIKRWILALIAVVCLLRVAVPITSFCITLSHRSDEAYPFSRLMDPIGNARDKNVFGMNEPGVRSNCEIIVSDVTRSQGLSYDHPSEGMEYVVVTVNIRNIGQVQDNLPDDLKKEDWLKLLSFDKKYFKMRTETGEMVAPSFSFAHRETALSSGYLAPWEQVSGTILFEVPLGTELQLYYYLLGIDFLDDDALFMRFVLE